MDKRGWNADRTGDLRKLPQAIARGQAEVLQQPLQERALQSRGCDEGGKRGSGNSHGDLASLDLTARCEFCETPLPDNCHGLRRYCSTQCYKQSERMLERQAAYHQKQRRACDQCGGAIPIKRKLGSKFCSVQCNDRYHRRTEQQIPCSYCGGLFRPRRDREQLYCSKTCQLSAMKDAQWAACNWCGQPYRRKRSAQLFCGASCSSKAKCHEWGNAIAVPLTVARLDRMLACLA